MPALEQAGYTTNSMMLFTHILAQSTDDDSSAIPALIAFLVVMTIVIAVIAYVRRNSKRSLDPAAREVDAQQDELLRQRSFEEKMRRVEERLRNSEAEGEEPPPTDSSEP